MKLECGFVGLPNVGKSTLFQAVTGVSVPTGNFPFCTVDPHHAFAVIPDERQDFLRRVYQSENIVPATVRVRDIAGLVKGAHRGEGLGNAFLSHIREVHAIVHVLRCFENSDIIHVEGGPDPRRDFDLIQTELLLADLQTMEGVQSRLGRRLKGVSAEETRWYENLVHKLIEGLKKGIPVGNLELSSEELIETQKFFLLTQKPQILVANLGDSLDSPHFDVVRQLGQEHQYPVVPIQGQLEAELIGLNEAEKEEFLSIYQLQELGLSRLIHTMKQTLGIKTFFTAGPKEVRAWNVKKEALAPACAGEIHSDIERGFIAADVFHVQDLKTLYEIDPASANEVVLRQKGLIRKEGKQYLVQDGDVINFLFNV